MTAANTIYAPSKRLLTRQQAAELLGIRPQTLAKWALEKSQNLPFVRVGRAVRYRFEDIEKFIEDNTEV